ncbi:MAG: M20 family metallopeptidase [Blastochloris sp.]|nr:M20 family metallopeptidase [Blastochloris sp.]
MPESSRNTASPSVSFGPGSIRQAHTRDEWIRLRDLEEGKNRFRKILDLLSAA